MPLRGRLPEILSAVPVFGETDTPGRILGTSREGRPVRGYRFAPEPSGLQPSPDPLRVSLIAGCHADEPVGPRLLRHLVGFLAGLSGDDPLRSGMEWWIVPHANPDGEERNRKWQGGPPHPGESPGSELADRPGRPPGGDGPEVYDLASYLAHVVRELPDDDMEFGFPRGTRESAGPESGEGGSRVEGGGRPREGGTRPENQAIYEWWRAAPGPFHLHASLHGMGFAAGPWLLIEPTWAERARPLRESFGREVEDLGYELHDVERLGEKGFFRLGRGFATRPDSRHMRDHFLARGDPETAARFRPSSMEAIRSLAGLHPPGANNPAADRIPHGAAGPPAASSSRAAHNPAREAADPLTLVTEMPLFLTPGVGKELGPPDRVSEEWKARIAGWRQSLEKGAPPDQIRDEAAQAGLRPMPVTSQMALQWAAIAGALELIR